MPDMDTIEHLGSAQWVATPEDGPAVVRAAGVLLAVLARTKASNLADLAAKAAAREAGVIAGLRKTKLTTWQMSAIDHFSGTLARLSAKPLVHLLVCTTCGEFSYVAAKTGERCAMTPGCLQKTLHVSKKAVFIPKGEEPDSAESFPFVPEDSVWGTDIDDETDDNADGDEWPDDEVPAPSRARSRRDEGETNDGGGGPSLAEVLGDF